MFAVNLKSLIYVNSSKLNKNVYCGIFRSGFVENIQVKNVSRKHFSTKFLRNVERETIISPVKTNLIVHRQINGKPVKKVSGGPIKWKTIIIVAVFGSLFVLLLTYLKNKKLDIREKERHRQIGKAKLGGRFELVDQDNKPLKSEDLYGNWLLIYFGFTHCPDICPEELDKMVRVVDTIDKNENMAKVKPVFITVDPDRDSPSVIKKYLKEFSDKIVGLTGTNEQVAAVCKAYRVYFSPGPKDSDADYIVDHSIIMYLVDPEGNFIDYYGQNKDADQIVNSIHFNQIKLKPPKSFFQKSMEIFSKE